MSGACGSRKTVLSTLIAAIALATDMPLALAQGNVLEEVIVTARKREESLQETPVAVTALSAD